MIPEEAWHDPYMPMDHLQAEIGKGVKFYSCDLDGRTMGVMGIQGAPNYRGGPPCDAAQKLTGEKLEYSLDFLIRAAFAKAGLEYSIGKDGAAQEVAASSGVLNGAAGRWAYFVNGVRTPYRIDSQSSKNVKDILFAYEKPAPH